MPSIGNTGRKHKITLPMFLSLVKLLFMKILEHQDPKAYIFFCMDFFSPFGILQSLDLKSTVKVSELPNTFITEQKE